MTERLDQTTGLVASIVLHGLMMLLFILMKVELLPFELDFTPVVFSSLAQVESGGRAAMAEFEAGGPQVELPQRPMLEDTSPLLKLPDSDRPAIEAAPMTKKTEQTAVKPNIIGARTDLLTGARVERERAPIEPLPLGGDALEGLQKEALSERLVSDEMFSISWEGPARAKVSGSLPEFPSGVNQAATVRLEFEVDRDGSVVYIAPITKGLPELERVSIDALRTWRFNVLDRALPQTKQKGVITFVFKLQ